LIYCSASLSSEAHSQLLLLLFSHPERFLFLTSTATIPLCFSVLYRIATCRGFPYVSPLQIQFPLFQSFFCFSYATFLLDFLNCLFACLLYAYHLMQRCLNCQSNFRLKVFLLFLTPTAVSFFVYSFFCFSHSSVLPDFLNWLFTLPPLRMPPHVTLCSSLCVSTSVVLQSCSSTRVPAVVFQHLRLNIHVPAVMFQHLRFSASTFHHL
jgi:hypothetical protein